MPSGVKLGGGDDLVCEVCIDHVDVVMDDICCCYVCVDCGEPLEPRDVKVVCGRRWPNGEVEKVL